MRFLHFWLLFLLRLISLLPLSSLAYSGNYYIINEYDENFPQGCNTPWLPSPEKYCILEMITIESNNNVHRSWNIYIAPADREINIDRYNADNYCFLENIWQTQRELPAASRAWVWTDIVNNRDKILNFVASWSYKYGHYRARWSIPTYTNCNIRWNCGSEDGNMKLSVRCISRNKPYNIDYYKIQHSILFESDGDIITQQNVINGETWSRPTDPHKEWYNFLSRYEEWSEEKFDFENTPITQDIRLYAKFEIAQFTISFVDEDGTEIGVITQDYNTNIQKSSDPTKKWYKFIGRDMEIPDTMPAENLTITAQWKKKSSGRSWGGWRSWWGWGSSSHGSADDNTPQRTWDTQDSSDKSSEWQTWSQMDTFPSPQNDKESELFDMHKWAYDNWLTIYKPWEDAKFDQPLTRQQMAKISSIFWYKFLNQKADDSEWKVYECSQYTDLHKSKWEMRWYVVQSCLLWNMWYAYDGVNLIKKFNPYNKLTVAQASVILSRMAWWTKYVISPKMWYQWHMQAVYDHGLIDDISNPQREVTRWEAFMMMYRLSKLMNESKN